MKKQTHRLLSLMLSLILVVGMIPGSLMTAYAAGTEIDTVEINGVEAPLPGKSSDVAPAGDVPAGANYTITERKWQKNGGQLFASGETFAANQQYWAKYTIEATGADTFASSITAKINGGNHTAVDIQWVNETEIVVYVKNLFAYPVVTIEDVTISGAVGSAITSTDVIVKVEGDTFRTSDLDKHDRLLISNLPAGLMQTIQRVDDTTAKITVAGTPTAQSDSAIIVSISTTMGALSSWPNSIIVKANNNAKFNITGAVSTALTGAVEISGTAKYGETLTAVVSGSNNTGTLQYLWMRSGSAITGATGETYTLTADDIGKEITVFVTSTVETGSLTSAAVTPQKADAPAAPAGLVGVAPTVGGGNDGKITGVTTAMKWSKNTNFSEDQWCTGTEITGLTGGTYYVRIAETATHKASDIVSVIVPGGSYQVSVIDGSADKLNATLGETVTITAYDMAGKKFVGWTTEDGMTFADATKATTTFTMPEKNVTVKANFEDLPATYHVTVVGGTADKTEYAPGETVTITAYPPASDMQFAKWTTEDGVTFADATKATTTFVMPTKDVRVDATYEDEIPSTYKVTVVGGNADKTEYAPGETVTITAYPPASDMQFAKWTTEDGVTFADATKATTTFVMPAKDVRVDATYEDEVIPPTTGGDTDNPQTGDNSMIWLWIALLFVSGAGVVATTVYGKKRFSVK